VLEVGDGVIVRLDTLREIGLLRVELCRALCEQLLEIADVGFALSEPGLLRIGPRLKVAMCVAPLD
jgi:hypothetical protein